MDGFLLAECLVNSSLRAVAGVVCFYNCAKKHPEQRTGIAAFRARLQTAARTGAQQKLHNQLHLPQQTFPQRFSACNSSSGSSSALRTSFAESAGTPGMRVCSWALCSLRKFGNSRNFEKFVPFYSVFLKPTSPHPLTNNDYDNDNKIINPK